MNRISCVLLVFISFTFLTFAQEQAVKAKDVPKPVLDAFRKSYPHAQIKGYSKEKEKGVLTYEIESTEGKTHRDVTYTAEGTLVSAEESMKSSDLPEAVKTTIQKEYPAYSISRCEKISADSTIQFEVVVKKEKKQIELVLDQQGKIVEKEESSGHED